MSYEEQDHEDSIAGREDTWIYSTMVSAFRHIARRQTQELRDEIVALSERVDALERMRNPQELLKPISVLVDRVDVMQRELAAHVADLRRHELHPAPPEADEPARLPQAEGPTITADDALREIEEALYPYVMNERQRPHVRAICVGYARAAALPERSAADPLTITWSRLSELLIVYVKAIPQGDTAHLTGLRAVVEALGYRMDGERP